MTTQEKVIPFSITRHTHLPSPYTPARRQIKNHKFPSIARMHRSQPCHAIYTLYLWLNTTSHHHRLPKGFRARNFMQSGRHYTLICTTRRSHRQKNYVEAPMHCGVYTMDIYCHVFLWGKQLREERNHCLTYPYLLTVQ